VLLAFKYSPRANAEKLSISLLLLYEYNRPSLEKNFIVGKPLIPKRSRTFGLSSLISFFFPKKITKVFHTNLSYQLTTAILTSSFSALASCSHVGSMCLQCPHPSEDVFI
jgi:hypothetical protein